jgi:hypothetical protein
MFRSYDHLQAEINISENNPTENGSVVFSILVNLVDKLSKLLNYLPLPVGLFPMYIFPPEDGRTTETYSE